MLTHALLPIIALLTSTTSAAPLEVPPPNPLPELITPIPPFQVTNFAAGAVIMSHRNYITFDVVLSPGLTPAHCHALGTTGAEALGTIRQTWCDSSTPSLTASSDDPDDDSTVSSSSSSSTSSSDPSARRRNQQSSSSHTEDVWFTFTVHQNQASEMRDQNGGADLRIVRQVGAHVRDEGVYRLAPEETPFVMDGTILVHQVYQGPENFNVAALRYEAF